jgi:regulator of protease activity HflC (stomatin/prohibitin superfamily)
VSNFEVAAIKLAQTNLRNIIGELELDQTLTSREMINTRLREVLDEATDRWGVRVTRVEIKKIDPPHDITEAMSRQMKAERTKRAAILDAEGIKQAAILEAEGKRQAAILEAEGKAEAVKKAADAEKYRLVEVANGEAQSIEMVFTAIHNGKPSNDLIAIRYLKTLEAMADGKANKMFIPYESSGIIGSLAQVAELFKKDSKAPVE